MNLGEVVGYWARWRPDGVALSHGDRSVSWAELAAGTGALAGGLAELGVRPGDRVGILGSNSPAWCELAIAVIRLGAAVVPLNVRATAPELSYMIDKVGCRAVAVDSGLAARLAATTTRTAPHRIILDAAGPPGPGPERATPVRAAPEGTVPDGVALEQVRGAGTAGPGTPEISDDTPAVIAFTSGTTGYPKAATLTHRNIMAMADTYTRWENWGSHTVGLCFAPLAFTGGVVNALLGTHVVGGRLILEDFAPEVALHRIVSVPVTAMTGVPIIYESIAALPGFAEADLSALSTTITGGSVVTEKLLRAWAAKGVRLRQAYGLTEAAGGSTLVPPHRYLDKSATAGVPSLHTRIMIEDASGGPAAPDEVGEILVRGPQVMAGYWDDEAETARALRGGWLHTGDLGRLDDEGFLTLVDRKNDMIISGGLNVYPAEIERVLAEADGVEEVAAVGVPHERWGETVAVVYRGACDPDALYRYASAHLADYKRPRYLRRATEPLPRGLSGKLLRRVIRGSFDPATAHRTPAT